LTGIYNDLGAMGKVSGITYHPKDHIIAFSYWGHNQPVALYTWDDNLPRIENQVSLK
jgi:hypothetical protein